jgi:hypothetical protein
MIAILAMMNGRINQKEKKSVSYLFRFRLLFVLLWLIESFQCNRLTTHFSVSSDLFIITCEYRKQEKEKANVTSLDENHAFPLLR